MQRQRPTPQLTLSTDPYSNHRLTAIFWYTYSRSTSTSTKLTSGPPLSPGTLMGKEISKV
jgi:hypothetical protein